MSNPERLVFTRQLGIVEELNVTVCEDDADAKRAVATPRPADIAYVLGGVSDEWFEEFLVELSKLCPHGRGTAIVMAATPSEDLLADVAKTEDEIALQNLAAGFGIDEAALVGTVEGAGWQLLPAAKAILARELPSADLLADVAGGDIDPGFGVDPEDSARLLQLRQAIDSIGWASPADEEKGDYLARLHEIREELAIKDMAIQRALRAEAQVRTQRIELRRFNREARARKEGAAAANTITTHPKVLESLVNGLGEAWPGDPGAKGNS